MGARPPHLLPRLQRGLVLAPGYQETQAARDLFERDGFRPTTITAIAARAGVSAESIYKGFGTKAALAKTVFDLVIAGDDEPVPVAERPAMLAIGDEPDVRRKVAMFVEVLAGMTMLGRYLLQWLARAITSALCP